MILAVSALPMATAAAPAAVLVPTFPLKVIAPVPAEELTVKSLKAVDAPIFPPNSTAPDPDVIVKVFPPSTVEVKVTAPLLLVESVSIVVFPARVTGPVSVTTPDTPSASSLSVAVVILPSSEMPPVDVNNTSFISVEISSILIVPDPAVIVTSVASSPSPAVPAIGTLTAIFPPPLPSSSVERVRSAISASVIPPSAPPSVKVILSLLVAKVESAPVIE